jgi:hypothetical protein
LIALGIGAATSAIGTGGLAALLWGAPELRKRDRWTVGAAMVGLIGAGAMLTTIGQQRVREVRR